MARVSEKITNIFKDANFNVTLGGDHTIQQLLTTSVLANPCKSSRICVYKESARIAKEIN
jgi:hypothetical protein